MPERFRGEFSQWCTIQIQLPFFLFFTCTQGTHGVRTHAVLPYCCCQSNLHRRSHYCARASDSSSQLDYARVISTPIIIIIIIIL